MNKWMKDTTGQMLVENVIVIGLMILVIIASIPSLRSMVFNKQFYRSSGEGSLSTGWIPAQLLLSDQPVIFCRGTIQLADKATIKGDIVTSQPIQPTGDSNHIGKVTTNQEQSFRFPLPLFPKFPYGSLPAKGSLSILENSEQSHLSENGYYEQVRLDSTLVIHTGDKDTKREIIMDELMVGSNGSLILDGAGALFLYIRNQFTIVGQATINPGGDAEQLVLYYQGKDPLTIPEGNQQITGSLYLENADIIISSENCSLQGNIISGGANIRIEKGSTNLTRTLLYAPWSHLWMSEDASLQGKVIANQITCKDRSQIKYQAVTLSPHFSYSLE